jgi:K+-transporting ATPase ATPase A chain
MTANGWLQIGVFFAAILAVTRPLGRFMTRVFTGERTPLDPILRPIERAIYRVTGVDEAHEMRWTEYAAAMLSFSGVSMLLLYLLQRVQPWLPFNPQHFGAVAPDLAFNTAASFTTNTNWQAYSGESTMSYLTQMAGLAYHNFVSAAVGVALAIAFIRGIARREQDAIGNFWVDTVRCLLWILLPFCVAGTLLLVSQGVVQNLRPYDPVTTVEGRPQVIAQGPVASQEIIKAWGTNGGGFFNANSAHPFENPTPLTNFLEMFAMFAISAGLTWTLGDMTGSALFATVTTDASCGAVNSMHDSFTPLGGLVPLVNIMLGEVIFGGVGAGLYGILVFIVLSVFIAGLMVGRTPEYLGKKIQAFDVQMAMLVVLVFPLTILVLTGTSVLAPSFGLASVSNAGPHGLSEILYAFTSGTGNNGSAFAGLNANTRWYNATIGASTLIGRFLMIVPMLAIAGSLGRKKRVPPSPGTFPVTTPLFSAVLVSVVVIVGALTFFPALSLGPIVEHLLMNQGQVF